MSIDLCRCQECRNPDRMEKAMAWIAPPTTQDIRYAWAVAGYEDVDFYTWLRAHDAEVREQVARDIEAQRLVIGKGAPYVTAWNDAVTAAARAARGGAA